MPTRVSTRSSGIVARVTNHKATGSGRARLEITVHKEETIPVSATFVFVTRFHMNYVLVLADKAANNVVVV